MTHEDFMAIKRFVDSYKETIENSSLRDKDFAKHGIEYCLGVLQIHFDFLEITREQAIQKEAQYHGH